MLDSLSMEPFKNKLGEHAAQQIAHAISRAHPKFDQKLFLKNLKQELEPLELKARMILLQQRLQKTLPADPHKSFAILIKSLQKNDSDKIGLSGFLVWPLTHYVTELGLDHFDLSMDALYQMTQVFTAEFAIRPFLIRHPQKTLKQLHTWINDSNEHVRRLVSEGSRPLLPWGQRIPEFVLEPKKTWPLLEVLKLDPSEYVRKSVANHINDHSKNHGDWVVKQLESWNKKHSKHKDVQWIIRHGTRTLVKKGHVQALALHGVNACALDVSQKVVTKKVRLGEFLKVQVTLRNTSKAAALVIVDHELLLLKASGRTSPKVFKGAKLTLQSGETRTLDLQVRIKKVTTRKYYAGKQGWTARVNGKVLKPLPFELAL